MTLKEELEILRGEPIQVFSGDPMDIPCIETSDSEKLCKHPVVSVNMITYNHEPYIRQAIEGVMMQETDFEFELVIGEDCSTDKTREICFEYQKKCPDKIRVLWWHENLYRNPHPAGGNGARNRAHCRGEFIALCEGDDYWTDPKKLQKQVDVMRKHPNVGMCFASGEWHYANEGRSVVWPGHSHYRPGIIPGAVFFERVCLGMNKRVGAGPEGFPLTASIMIRKRVLEQARREYDIFRWRLSLGDKMLHLGMSSLSDVFYHAEAMATYRIASTGAMGTNGARVLNDSNKIKLYFALKCNSILQRPFPLSLINGVMHVKSEGLTRTHRAQIRAIINRWLMDGVITFAGARQYDKLRWFVFLRTGMMWQFYITSNPVVRKLISIVR